MSCCGCCGGQDTELKNEQDKNKDEDVSSEAEQAPVQAVKQEKPE